MLCLLNTRQTVVPFLENRLPIFKALDPLKSIEHTLSVHTGLSQPKRWAAGRVAEAETLLIT